MIDVVELTKVFGKKVAVDRLSFSVQPGIVTGFLGPNGAGKSTTMRLILGLDRPTRGRASVDGQSYARFAAPMTRVGSLLEAKSVHPGRTARNHLRALAATHGLPDRRVDEVIELVGLGSVAKKRAGGFSLGMSQRLGLAAALLGDPQTLILDEPVNGLDPEGVAWVRGLVRHLADQERTVFISSHLMSEMALTADRVVIIGRGRLIADARMSELISRASGVVTEVRSPDRGAIAEAARAAGHTVTNTDNGMISITGWSSEAVGEEAARRGWVLHELRPVQRSLEEVYMELTTSAVEFHASAEAELDDEAAPVGFWSGAVPAVAPVEEAVGALDGPASDGWEPAPVIQAWERPSGVQAREQTTGVQAPSVLPLTMPPAPARARPEPEIPSGPVVVTPRQFVAAPPGPPAWVPSSPPPIPSAPSVPPNPVASGPSGLSGLSDLFVSSAPPVPVASPSSAPSVSSGPSTPPIPVASTRVPLIGPVTDLAPDELDDESEMTIELRPRRAWVED